MSRDFDFIVTSRPVDATAAKVLTKGEHFDPKKAADPLHHSDLPIPTVPFTGPKEHDISGMRTGSLVVQGYVGKGHSAGRWAVRCDCGHFETRSVKAMRNPLNKDDCCRICRQTRNLRRKSLWIQSGRPEEQQCP